MEQNDSLTPTTQAKSPAPEALTRFDRIPSNWKLEVTDSDGDVEILDCTNTVTGRKFSGTIQQFNEFIKS
jgi:hypothetical protein